MEENWRGLHPAVDGERLKMLMMMKSYMRLILAALLYGWVTEALP
jgi:hypothetical protein